MGTLIVCGLIGVPFAIGYVVGHARGHTAGAVMMIERVGHLIRMLEEEADGRDSHLDG